MEVNPKTVGVPWFTRETWQRHRDIASDRDDLPETFEEWQGMAAQRFEALKRQGYPLVKVMVDIEELAAFARRAGRQVDAECRQLYAAAVEARRHGHRVPGLNDR